MYSIKNMQGDTSQPFEDFPFPHPKNEYSLTKKNNFFCLFFLALGVLFLSSIPHFINFTITHYQGNNYFPPHTFLMLVSLLLMLLGGIIQFGRSSSVVRIIQELIAFFSVMAIIAFATNGIQFTPFPPIDKQILQLEQYLGINLAAIMHWTYTKPGLRIFLGLIYDSLPYQMSFLPFILILQQQYTLLREYYCLLLLTTLLGFSFYYFFPTLGPASFISSPYFIPAQFATGIKFMEIHHYLKPSTIEGGLIAFPSFHAIWAILCVRLVWHWSYLFYLLLLINLILIGSCILLGWHYPLDIGGSFLVLLISYSIYKYIKPLFKGLKI